MRLLIAVESANGYVIPTDRSSESSGDEQLAVEAGGDVEPTDRLGKLPEEDKNEEEL